MATDNTQQNNPQGGGATGTVERSERSGQKPSEKMTPLNAADDSIDPQEYSRLLDLYDNSFRNIAEGEVVKGTVLKVTASEVIVDVGYKSEGIIPSLLKPTSTTTSFSVTLRTVPLTTSPSAMLLKLVS